MIESSVGFPGDPDSFYNLSNKAIIIVHLRAMSETQVVMQPKILIAVDCFLALAFILIVWSGSWNFGTYYCKAFL